MSKLPRVVIAAGLGVGAFLGVDNTIDREPQLTYAVEHVNFCVEAYVEALGNQAISAVELNSACTAYANTFVPVKVGAERENPTLTFKLPSLVELLEVESGKAALIDENIIESNAKERGVELLVAGLAGLAVAFAVGSRETVKKLDNIPFRRQKKSSRVLPQV